MESEDLILVGVDDHVVQPPDVFAHHLPNTIAGHGPRVLGRSSPEDVVRR